MRLNYLTEENYAWKIIRNVRNVSKYQIEITSTTFSTHEIHFIHVQEEQTDNMTFGEEMTLI